MHDTRVYTHMLSCLRVHAFTGGEFFARVTYRVLYENETPLEAIKLVANAFPSQFIKEKVQYTHAACLLHALFSP